jgi:hypothetical protein
VLNHAAKVTKLMIHSTDCWLLLDSFLEIWFQDIFSLVMHFPSDTQVDAF